MSKPTPKQTQEKPATAPQPPSARERGHMIHVEVDEETRLLFEQAAARETERLGVKVGVSTWLRNIGKRAARAESPAAVAPGRQAALPSWLRSGSGAPAEATTTAAPTVPAKRSEKRR